MTNALSTMQNVLGKTLTSYLGLKRRRTDTSLRTDPAPPTTAPSSVRENAFQMQTESYDGSQSNLSSISTTSEELTTTINDELGDELTMVYKS